MDPSYLIRQVENLGTPVLVFYEEKIRENIARMGDLLDGYDRLRPHIKTHKCREVLDLQMEAGITRFKCATLKEADLAAGAGAAEILLAYPVVGAMVPRVAALQKAFPLVRLDVLADDPDGVIKLSRACLQEGVELGVMVDINPGMDRTGVASGEAIKLARIIQDTPGLRFTGLHMYESRVAPGGAEQRTLQYQTSIQKAITTRRELERVGIPVKNLVTAGSLDCAIAAGMEGVDEVSPGTWILWDKGYEDLMPRRFVWAALVIGRVISRPSQTLFTVDAGTKSVSADPAIPHAHVLSVPNATVVGRWEEHLVVRLESPSSAPEVGAPVYLVPVHVCSTVNLWDEAVVIDGSGEITARWKIAARGH